MNRGLLQMVFCALLLTLTSSPAWGVCRPENRVGKFFSSPLKSAADFASQPVDTRRENAGYGYDFASGVHKYLYCQDNPVNGSDPSGNETLISINASMGIMSFMVSHEMRGAHAALTGVRAMFGADEDLNKMIYNLEVGMIVNDTVGQVALGVAAVGGGIRLFSWISSTTGSQKIAKGVMSSLSKVASLFPSKKVKPVSPPEEPYLYRVIFPASQDYGKFAQVGSAGSVTPRGSGTEIMEHLYGRTENSIYTSWSKDPQGNWARWSSAPGAIQLRVDTRSLQNAGLDVTDIAGSDEFLLIGETLGVQRVR